MGRRRNDVISPRDDVMAAYLALKALMSSLVLAIAANTSMSICSYKRKNPSISQKAIVSVNTCCCLVLVLRERSGLDWVDLLSRLVLLVDSCLFSLRASPAERGTSNTLRLGLTSVASASSSSFLARIEIFLAQFTLGLSLALYSSDSLSVVFRQQLQIVMMTGC